LNKLIRSFNGIVVDGNMMQRDKKYCNCIWSNLFLPGLLWLLKMTIGL